MLLCDHALDAVGPLSQKQVPYQGGDAFASWRSKICFIGRDKTRDRFLRHRADMVPLIRWSADVDGVRHSFA